MKVGIVTFHRAVNYGAVLQTYALQQTLQKMQIENDVIDYRSKCIEKLYCIWKPLLSNLRTLQIYPRTLKKIRFGKFINKHIIMSRSISSSQELKELNMQYDFFITGSDQVWCEKCARSDQTYFLNFADPRKKRSYAASIGKDTLSESMEKEYKKLLYDYNVVSVREQSAAQIVKKIEDDIVTYVNIDPTLLLDDSEWKKIAVVPPIKTKYILMYTVLGQYYLFDFARKLSKKTGLPIIYLNEEMMHKYNEFKYKTAVSPEEFVGYFLNAEYVVTNSFHGTAFSIINHKNFFVEIDAVGRKNTRAEELLAKLGIKGREIKDIKDNYDAEIEWEKIEEKLERERKKSKEYLESVLR